MLKNVRILHTFNIQTYLFFTSVRYHTAGIPKEVKEASAFGRRMKLCSLLHIPDVIPHRITHWIL